MAHGAERTAEEKPLFFRKVVFSDFCNEQIKFVEVAFENAVDKAVVDLVVAVHKDVSGTCHGDQELERFREMLN